MNMTSKYLHLIHDFFDSYAGAFEKFDARSMVKHFALPCMLIDSDHAEVFADAAKLEGQFSQGTQYYKQLGIMYARPEVWSKRLWTEGIVKVKVNWTYYDQNKQKVYGCDYQYILRLTKRNQWQIELAASLNEKQHFEQWQGRQK